MPLTNFDALNLQTVVVKSAFIAGAQTTGNKKWGWLVSGAGTIIDVRAYLDTAPTGAAFVLDLRLNNVSLYTTTANRPTIPISGNASTLLLPDTVAVAAGDRLSLDIVTIGSTIAGSDLYFAVTMKRVLV